MRDDRKEMLTEQYEEAWFDLMLDQYAEEEGNRLLEEYRQAAPATVSPELDRKCREAAQKVFKYHDRKLSLRSTARRAGRAAVIGLVTLGLFATMVMSVDALRIPTLEFFTKQYEKFTTITKPDNTRPPIPENMLNDGSPLAGILANTFQTIGYETTGDGIILAAYTDTWGRLISFSRSPLDGSLDINSEGAQRQQIEIRGFAGEMLIMENQKTIYWIDEVNEYVFVVSTRNMLEAEVWRIAEDTAKKFKEEISIEESRYVEDGPLAGILPGTYKFLRVDTLQDGTISCAYKELSGNMFFFSTYSLDSFLNIDTEGAERKQITVQNYDGEIIMKGEELAIYWINTDDNLIYHIWGKAVPASQMHSYALAIEQKFCIKPEFPNGSFGDGSPLEGLLPDGYALTNGYSEKDEDFYIYATEKNHYVKLIVGENITYLTGILAEKDHSKARILNYEGLMIWDEDETIIYWTDPTAGLSYLLATDSMLEGDFWHLAVNAAAKFSGQESPY